MQQFFLRHPFYKNLIKLAAYIVVGYNTLALCVGLPIVFLIIFSIAVSSAFGGGSLSEDPFNSPLGNLQRVSGAGTNQLLSIKVNGLIMGEESDDSGSFLGLMAGESYGYTIKEQLMEAANLPDIKGVILEINSPGGTIFGSHAIADGVKYYRDKTKKPVYAFVSGLGASGAYWAAASADKVLADYGSEVGSIGVIMGPFEYYDKVVATDGGLLGGGVVTQNGVEQYYISAGRSKDLGNPYRRLTADELAALQRQINNDYDVFVNYVGERRKISPAVIKSQIGALTYDNATAKAAGLIDDTASREDAYDRLAEAAGVKGDYEVVRQSPVAGFWQSLLSAVTGKPGKTAANSTSASATSPAARTCALTKVVLAYHGNLADLCPAQ